MTLSNNRNYNHVERNMILLYICVQDHLSIILRHIDLIHLYLQSNVQPNVIIIWRSMKYNTFVFAVQCHILVTFLFY